jgi:PPOX class probable FMN-dependent enzyme
MSIAEDHRITTQEEVTALYGAADDAVKVKTIAHLDEHCRAFIAASPFAVVATTGDDGACDASPRGGAPGFCDVTGPTTLVLPDQPGNRRLDTVRNVVATGQIGIVFLIPGLRETLRVNGRASVTTDPDLLARYADGRKPPIAGIVVDVEEAYLHCAKAFIRSGLWEPDSWQGAVGVASPARIWKDHIAIAAMSEEDVAAYVEDDYTNNLRWGDREQADEGA